MDPQSTPQDAPPVDPVQDPTTPAPAVDDVPNDAPIQEGTPEAPSAPEAETVEEEEDYGYPDYQLPQMENLDLSKLPVDENNLIDPNALAGVINQQIATAEERATMRAQQAFQEQQAETKAWEKAYEKYPDLKGNKELRDMVQQTRIGQFTDAFSKTKNPSEVKLRSPMQVAETLFRHIGSAKQEGMKQATTNTVVQQSAYTETAGRRTDDSADARSKSLQNINNPNKEIARKARSELLQRIAFGE